jgi:hypothetical protein
MINSSRQALALALLAGISLLGIDTARAQKPSPNFNRIVISGSGAKLPNITPRNRPDMALAKKSRSKLKPKATLNAAKSPRSKLDLPRGARRLSPAHQVDLGKKSRAAKRDRSPSNANTPVAGPNVVNIAPRPRLKLPKMNADVPTGGLINLPNNPAKPSGANQDGAGAAGAQNTPTVPLPAEPPFNDNLGDAITVTGGVPDWWSAWEIVEDVVNRGPGEFQPDLPGGPKQPPEIDLNPFGPERPGGSGQHGVGPQGWPGSGRGTTGLQNPSGQVSRDYPASRRSDEDGDGEEDATIFTAFGSDGDTTYTHEVVFYDDGRWTMRDTFTREDGTEDTYISVENADGQGKHVHLRNGEPVNDVVLSDPIVISSDEDTGDDDGEENGSGNSEDDQPGAEGTERPRGGARDVRCDWWGCVDNGVSTPVQTNPGHEEDNGSITLSSGTGPGAATDPTPMDDTTLSGGGGYEDPAPDGNPGGPEGPGT